MAICSNSIGRRGTILRGLVVFLLCFVLMSLVWLSAIVVYLDRAAYPVSATDKWYLPKRVYEVAGAIRVAPVVEVVLRDSGDKAGVTEYQSFKYTQAALITSPRVVERVADDLAGKNLKFFEDYRSGRFARSRRKNGNETVVDGPAEVLKQAILDGVIKAAVVKKTELIKVTMRGTNPEEARQIVDSFISSYMAVEVAAKGGDKGLRLLENESKVLEMRVKSIREKIRQLSLEYDTVTPDIQGLQDQLAWVKECYNRVCRRMNEMKMERKRPGRVSVAYYAEVMSVHSFWGIRFKATIAVLLSALICSSVLAIIIGRSDRKSRTTAKSEEGEVT